MSAWVETRRTTKGKRYYIGWRKNGMKQKVIPAGDSLSIAKMRALQLGIRINKYNAYKIDNKIKEAIKNASMD